MLLAAGAMLGARADYKAESKNGYTWIYEQEGEESFIVGIAETPSGTLSFPAELGGKPVRNLVGHGYGSFGKYLWQESKWSEDGGYWSADWNVSNDWFAEVTKLVIPEGVTNIYDRFFQANYWVDGETGLRHCSGWYNLNEVELPDTLKSCVIREVFCNTPYSLSDDIAELVLSKSGRKLYGIKVYGKEFDWDAKYPDVVIPETIVEIADYALPYIMDVAWRDEYGNPSGCSGYPMGTTTKRRRIVFAGAKPKSSDMAFADWDTEWDEERGVVVRLYKIRGDAVYYHEGASGWTWGEEWCGVKTYALNEVPDAYSVESNLKFGRVYGCEIPGADYVGLKTWGIWGNNDIGLYDDEYALIPVTGTGTIKPVILGDVPSGYLDTPQVWTDQKMFNTVTPKGVATSKWETADYNDDLWYYETSKVEYEWPKNIWPDKKPVADRRWIVIHAKGKEVWSGVWSFRVGLAGTSEISDPMIVVPSEECIEDNGLLNLSLSDFFRGISISGYENFELWDEAVVGNGSGNYADLPRMQTYELENWRANHLSGKAMTFKVMLPSAGTLVLSSADDDDSPAIKSAYSVKGSGIVSDLETVTSAEWESPNYRYNTTNFWKTSYASHIRRIEVSGNTTLTLTSTYGEDDCEFNRMYFFPKTAKSVAVEVGHIKWEPPSGEYSYWGRNYVQGYVTGCGVYKSGETVTLRTVSGEGEIFDHWEVQFGNLTLTEAQKRNPTLSFTVTDAMCGEMEDEEQIFISAIWKPKYKITALPSIVGAGTVTGTGRYHEGAVVTLTATAAEGCTFVKWSDGETAPTRQIEVVAADVERVLYACFDAPNGVLNPDAYRVFFDGNGGEVSEQMRMVEKGKSVGALPTDPVREKYKFLGWYTAKDGGMKISEETKVTADVTFYAHWKKSSTPAPMPTPEPEEVHELYEEFDGAAPVTVASEYNGYLYDEKSGAMKGTIQVKVGKPGKKDGAASVKATVVVGTKKVTLKAKDKGKAVIEKNGPTEIELVGGEACVIVLGADGMSGEYGAYLIDGSRNFFASKDKGEVEEANTILSKWLGSFMVIWDGGSLSVSIAAKGKVKVSGTLANGKTKVSVSTVLLVGEEWCCISVAEQKANLAFALWLSNDGQTVEAEGLGDDVLVGKPGSLANGAAFHVDADEFASVFGQAMLPYLPDGVPVAQKGTKWSLPKAGKVVYKNGAVDKSKLGDNPCALKLTYKAKEGTFKGSFKVYTEVKGKPKATTVNVTGFLLNGIGYGTATIKGKGSVSVTIE